MAVDWDLLERLMEIPGPPGMEEPVASLIAGEAERWASVQKDRMGNLYASMGTDSPHVIFCAHMDEVGLLATGVEDDGAIRFRPLGGVDEATLPGRHVRVLTSQRAVPGVIGISPPHLREGGDTPTAWRDLSIDAGAKSREEAAALGILPPQPVTLCKLDRPLRTQNVIIGKGLDDRVGCFLLLHLLRRVVAAPPPVNLTFLWTVQDEVGLRGAQHAARDTPAGYVVQWDTVSDNAQYWGRGPLIRARDDGSLADPGLLHWACDCATRAGVPFRVGACRGESEAKVFQNEGARIVSVNIAVANMHTESEMVAQSDVAALLQLGEEMVVSLPTLAGGRLNG